MTTYLVQGFLRDKPKDRTVRIIVDAEFDPTGLNDPGAVAQRIAGDAYCFPLSTDIDKPVPDDCKGVLFQSDDEFFARLPQLDWRPKRRRRKA